jgi:hypothetical protein
MVWLLVFAPLLAIVTPAVTSTAACVAPSPAASATPYKGPGPHDNDDPTKLFVEVRNTFRSHRPPPAYEVYTLDRKQLTDQGFPDYANSYKVKYWVRNLDRAALTRKIYRSINRGEMTFDRPAFNEERDPGPPTADLFEPAPVHSHPVTFVPTPEPVQTALPIIGSVVAKGLFDYRVTAVAKEGDELHLSVLPTRDPDRNRLREIYVDRTTLELRKIVATDKLFILGTSDVYGVTFTITMGSFQTYPVVCDIHGVVGDGYSGDGSTIDYTFRDISFPSTLPAWYFDNKQYAQHESEEPM